jgi:hypothetical protein
MHSSRPRSTFQNRHRHRHRHYLATCTRHESTGQTTPRPEAYLVAWPPSLHTGPATCAGQPPRTRPLGALDAQSRHRHSDRNRWQMQQRSPITNQTTRGGWQEMAWDRGPSAALDEETQRCFQSNSCGCPSTSCLTQTCPGAQMMHMSSVRPSQFALPPPPTHPLLLLIECPKPTQERPPVSHYYARQGITHTHACALHRIASHRIASHRIASRPP